MRSINIVELLRCNRDKSKDPETEKKSAISANAKDKTKYTYSVHYMAARRDESSRRVLKMFQE